MSSPTIIEIAVGVVLSGDRVLVTRRPAGTHLEGLWEFPGGKLEPGETLEAFVRREVLEETGILIEVSSLLETLDYSYGDREVRLHFFICRPEDAAAGITADGAHDPHWVPLAEIRSLPMPPANVPIVARLIARTTPGGTLH